MKRRHVHGQTLRHNLNLLLLLQHHLFLLKLWIKLGVIISKAFSVLVSCTKHNMLTQKSRLCEVVSVMTSNMLLPSRSRVVRQVLAKQSNMTILYSREKHINCTYRIAVVAEKARHDGTGH